MSASHRRVILTVFAGRRRYLDLLRRYLDRLLDRSTLTEVHLWDYTRNDADRDYVASLAANVRYRIFHPDRGDIHRQMHQWDEYYRYYAQEGILNDDDILVKCDDDVVYLDVDAFPRYIQSILGGADVLYFPNIVNNDVSAYLQSRCGVHDLLPHVDPSFTTLGCETPLTGDGAQAWYRTPDLAWRSHDHFLGHVGAYARLDQPLMPWGSRISINFFGGTARTIRRYYAQFLELPPQPYVSDETFLSSIVCRQTGQPNVLVPYFTVVHFAFGPQASDELDTWFLPQYLELAVGIQ